MVVFLFIEINNIEGISTHVKIYNSSLLTMEFFRIYNVFDLQKTCSACPTRFKWKSELGESFYFRLRHGFAFISDENDNYIISGSMYDFDGICSWEDVRKWAYKNKIILIEYRY